VTVAPKVNARNARAKAKQLGSGPEAVAAGGALEAEQASKGTGKARAGAERVRRGKAPAPRRSVLRESARLAAPCALAALRLSYTLQIGYKLGLESIRSITAL
jgi:hypothetical protein